MVQWEFRSLASLLTVIVPNSTAQSAVNPRSDSTACNVVPPTARSRRELWYQSLLQPLDGNLFIPWLEMAGAIQWRNHNFRLLGVNKYLHNTSEFPPKLWFTTTHHFIRPGDGWPRSLSSIPVRRGRRISFSHWHRPALRPDAMDVWNNFIGGNEPRSWSWQLPPRAKNEWSYTSIPNTLWQNGTVYA